MITLKNTGDIAGRVFASTGAIAVLEAGEVRDVPFNAGEYEVEAGANIVAVEKDDKAEKAEKTNMAKKASGGKASNTEAPETDKAPETDSGE